MITHFVSLISAEMGKVKEKLSHMEQSKNKTSVINNINE